MGARGVRSVRGARDTKTGAKDSRAIARAGVRVARDVREGVSSERV